MVDSDGMELDAYITLALRVDCGAEDSLCGEVNLFDEKLVTTFSGGIKYESDATKVYSFLGDLSIIAMNRYTPPNGSIFAYVIYPEPYLAKKCGCLCCGKACGCIYYPSIREAEYRKTLAEYEARSQDELLLLKHQTLFRVNLQ